MVRASTAVEFCHVDVLSNDGVLVASSIVRDGRGSVGPLPDGEYDTVATGENWPGSTEDEPKRSDVQRLIVQGVGSPLVQLDLR